VATEKADVLVIGSGPAGAAITKRLTDRGAKVVCLEQGDWVKPGEYPSTRPNWEAATRRGPFHFDPNVRRRPEDYPIVSAGPNPPVVQMGNGVGGTVHWDCNFPRLHPSDFRSRTLDGVGDDWPIQYRDLVPYYDTNDREMGVSGLQGDPANPPRSQRPTPPLPVGLVGETMARGLDKLGWYWWVSDVAVISRDYDGRLPCGLHGKCSFGCPIRAKATADVTYWPKALKKGALLKTWARVREVTLDAQGRATGAVYFDRDGKLHEQLARVVVICCNGIGTPRLLLNSKSKLFPQGLANSSGLVGKNLMIHAHGNLEGVFEERLDGDEGVPPVMISQQFYETDPKRNFARGYSFNIRRIQGPLSYARGGSVGKPVPWGANHHRLMRERFPHMIGISVLGEDLANDSNRVELDPQVADSNGIPAAKVVYAFDDNTVKMIEHAHRMARLIFEAAGAIDVFDRGPLASASHLMGTARMGTDPKLSVINAWNQAHDVKNLFIVDGSSFVTSGAANPTSTIGALALRAADGIWDRRRDWN
jgi:choline dehydrogenase-like flavoprotein